MSFFISIGIQVCKFYIAILSKLVTIQQLYELCLCWLKEFYFWTLLDFYLNALIFFSIFQLPVEWKFLGYDGCHICGLIYLFSAIEEKKVTFDYCMNFFVELKYWWCTFLWFHCVMCTKQLQLCVVRNLEQNLSYL